LQHKDTHTQTRGEADRQTEDRCAERQTPGLLLKSKQQFEQFVRKI